MRKLSLLISSLVSCSSINLLATPATISVDGSSTVYPITAAIAEEFQRTKEYKEIHVTVASSGTGGGFKKWSLGETDINDASRPIKDSEAATAKQNGIQYLEIPVANDGLSVVVSQKNNFVKSLTMDQLKKLWEPGSKIKNWKELDPSFPDKAIQLYGPGTDSGTFDYFTEEVVGKSRASRSDYIASEDDNVLVKGIGGSELALGYFGYAYFRENEKTLRSIPIAKDKQKPVAPVDATILDHSYPLARPIFIYVSSKAIKRPEVQNFVRFYLKQVPKISKEVGYTPLKTEQYEKATASFEAFIKSSAKVSETEKENNQKAG